ncbi:DUF3883 domain-containing protein [Vibrio cholerae]|uniref:protein NO VEIN domain-containing protein n=1 Tax=Vibrio cholerae TaxID=666 RepID=UPI001A205BAE|nr:DUF3883 domain-containing protein [Vibrio cholerae]EGQ8013397.1 DUF3883 domain-containing protein [Vibrio cholerae]EGR0568761.1 DUF3883 domain-containing protein [Vibrio cholerae]EGR0889721.1 DUF3883 domain-containing protein [Vibrio cholerae]EGR1094290.1 DUF3883 domain-containing protein [Vibrio cholerae]EGR1328317.1 DUF3883 domain-containing protein [Vibrio cholerae]
MTSQNIYKTPEAYLFPLHIVRPRFKNNVENVLFYMAKEISSVTGSIDSVALNKVISGFPGNNLSKTKTVDNWRTEISALLGLMQYKNNFGFFASSISKRLAEKEDLIEFFKNFSMKLQFPNGMLKPHVNKELISRGVNFAPLKFLKDLLTLLEKNQKGQGYITKDELTYVVFDDIRFTSGSLLPENAKDIIIENRKLNVLYEQHRFIKGFTYKGKPDQTRTAMDFLDYMQLGNLLIRKSSKYFLNEIEHEFLSYAYSQCGCFDGFLKFYNKEFDVSELNDAKNAWFDYVNDLDFSRSATNIGKFIRTNSKDDSIILELNSGQTVKMTTKDIGDMGESIVIAHEQNKLIKLGLEHNKHLVQFIPTHLGAGYDVKSMDEMDNQIFIEVKTTLSNHPITQSRISLTKNEWNAAYTHRDNYYIYRLIITNESRKLLVMANPVKLIQEDKVKLSAPQGVELIFKPTVMEEVEILA